MKKYFIMAAIAAVTLASCSTADDEVATNPSKTTDPVAVTLSNTLSKATTRANTTLQTEYIASTVKVGVSVFRKDATAASGLGNYGYVNKQYNANGSGSLTVEAGSEVYYPADKGAVDIYAYAPMKTGVTDATAAMDFSVAESQSTDDNYLASDLIYSELKNVSSSTTAQSLTFAHKLTRIGVVLIAGSGVNATDLAAATIKIKNTKLATTFVPTTGVITAPAAETNATDITASTNSDKGYAIIVPQTVALVDGGTPFIEITIGTNTYVYKLEAAATFAAATQYTYNLTLKTNGVTLTSTKITAWTDATEVTAVVTEN